MITSKKLLSTVKRYKEIQEQEKRLADEKESLREILVTAMKERKLEELLIDIYQINYNKHVQTRFNSKLFKEEEADLYEEYCYSQEVEKIVVK